MYVDDELVNREGRLYQVEGDNLTALPKDRGDLRLLEERLKLAVESENYEEAARLRDLIRERRHSES